MRTSEIYDNVAEKLIFYLNFRSVKKYLISRGHNFFLNFFKIITKQVAFELQKIDENLRKIKKK